MMQKAQGHIYIIDDDHSMRRALDRSLSSYGYTVSTFEGFNEFLKDPQVLSPSILLLDMRMPRITGIEIQSKLDRLKINIPIIFISGESTKEQIIKGLKAGAIDFLLKPFVFDKLLESISIAMLEAKKRIRDKKSYETSLIKFKELTPREIEVAKLVAKGLMNIEIGELLHISDATVKVHKARVFEKMLVNSPVALSQLLQDIDINH